MTGGAGFSHIQGSWLGMHLVGSAIRALACSVLPSQCSQLALSDDKRRMTHKAENTTNMEFIRTIAFAVKSAGCILCKSADAIMCSETVQVVQHMPQLRANVSPWNVPWRARILAKTCYICAYVYLVILKNWLHVAGAAAADLPAQMQRLSTDPPASHSDPDLGITHDGAHQTLSGQSDAASSSSGDVHTALQPGSANSDCQPAQPADGSAMPPSPHSQPQGDSSPNAQHASAHVLNQDPAQGHKGSSHSTVNGDRQGRTSPDGTVTHAEDSGTQGCHPDKDASVHSSMHGAAQSTTSPGGAAELVPELAQNLERSKKDSLVGRCRYSRLSRLVKARGLTPQQLTAENLDRSGQLGRVIRDEWGGQELCVVAELQWAYLAFLLCQSLEGAASCNATCHFHSHGPVDQSTLHSVNPEEDRAKAGEGSGLCRVAELQ